MSDLARLIAAVTCALAAAAAPTTALAQHHGDTFGGPPLIQSPCKDTAEATPEPGLRQVDFYVTTDNPVAKGFFSQGLTLVYAFNHQDAMRAFRSAVRADDKLAMAHWGIALAAGPNINVDMDPDCRQLANQEVETAWQLAQEPKVTAKERDLIGALRARYSGAAHYGTDYALAMAKVADTYKTDPDVLSLYAESLMDLRPWGLYDRAGRPATGTPEIVGVLRRAVHEKSDHIGANHYLIHAIEGAAFDRDEALASAELLRKKVPEAGHLQHMASHIYMRLGLYHQAAEANDAAVKADRRKYGPACDSTSRSASCLELYYGHYLSHNLAFLAAAATMEGDLARALDFARQTTEHALRFVKEEPGLEHYLNVYLVTLVNLHRWDEVLKAQPIPDYCHDGCPDKQACYLHNAMVHWARAMASAAKGQVNDAEGERSLFNEDRHQVFNMPWGNNTAESVFKIADAVLRARIATARHRLDSAIEALRVAVSLEDDLIYDEPPTWLYSTREALGGALLAAGRAAEARQAFAEDLAAGRNPESGRSLFGLAKALQQLHEPWEEIWRRYKMAWHGPELTVPDLW